MADYDEVEVRHREATRRFIQALQDLKPKQPWEWNPTELHRSSSSDKDHALTIHDAEYAAKILEESVAVLKIDRETYPDWLVCPYRQRAQLSSQLSAPWPNPKNLSYMAAAHRENLLYEIVWSHKVTYKPPALWLVKELLIECSPEQPSVLTKRQQLEIALFLLKSTRWMEKEAAREVVRKTHATIDNGKKYWPEIGCEVAYHNALVARDKFDYPALEKHIKEINTATSTWKLRKASLLAEIGKFKEGEELVVDAYRELLGHYRNSKGSINLLSRLAWAHWVLRGIDLSLFKKEYTAFPSSYRDSKCDPFDHIEHIRDRVSNKLEKQRNQQLIEPMFEPGRYRDNSKTFSLSDELHPLFLLDGIAATVGVPLKWNFVSFLVEQGEKLAELEDIDTFHRFSIAIRSASCETSNVLKKVFSRVRVACLSENEVAFLLNRCECAINYWIARRKEEPDADQSYAIARLRVFIEVMARVSVRATPDQAKRVFRLATTLCNRADRYNFWLIDPIKNLVNFALTSIPPSQQNEVLLDALLFPLPTEIGAADAKELANPVVAFPGERRPSAQLDRRIDEIIEKIAPCSAQSASALLRLLPLIENGFLTKEELNKISEVVWGATSKQQVLPETGLFKYVLLKLPARDHSVVKDSVRNYLFEAKGEELFSPEVLTDIASAACEAGEFPSEDQAVVYFKLLVSWRPQEDHNDIMGFSKQENQRVARLVGRVLARSVVPALPVSFLTEENFLKVYEFDVEVDSPEVIAAFPRFCVAHEVFEGRVEKVIRRGLQSEDENRQVCASHALLTWRRLQDSVAVDRLIVRLVYLIGVSRKVGLPELLWVANRMYREGFLPRDQIESLVETLPIIFDSTAYKSVIPTSKESVNISFVRAACVRLARDLMRNGVDQRNELCRISDEATGDALPEVRFADWI